MIKANRETHSVEFCGRANTLCVEAEMILTSLKSHLNSMCEGMGDEIIDMIVKNVKNDNLERRISIDVRGLRKQAQGEKT